RHQALLVLDRRGVSGPALPLGFVPWHAIERVALADRRGRAVLVAIDEKRLSEADRVLMRGGGAARNADGFLTTLIKVRELPIGAEALATLLAQHARAAEIPA